MIETKPRINRGNRGQLFRATWLSSARCSETFRRTTERVECSKYKDLEIETSRMWGMRTETIPVVIGALGAIKKGLETYLGRILGQISISELQKIILLGTAHILRRVLSN